MRPSRQHGLTGIAIAVSLALALALALVAAPGTSAAPLLGLEGLPKVQVQVGGLINVEAEPLPAKVEVAGLPPIETPSLPKAELPATPPVEAPKAPVEVPTVPTGSTPLPTPTGSSSSPTPTSSSTGSGARASSVGASAASGASAPTAGNTSSSAPATAQIGKAAHTAARHRRGAARSRAGGARLAGAGTSKTAAAASAPGASSAALARASGAKGADSKTTSSNPLESIGRQIPFPVPVPDWSKPIILVLLLLAILFAVRSRLATLRARRLEGQRETMLSDLDDMQAALVPAIPERLGGLAVSVAYRPADGPAAGGDFYDLFELEPGRVAIVLGDVVGHGRPALTQAALTRYTLRAYLQAGLEPRAALALAGSVLATPGEKRFATVVVAIHDSATGGLTYACAGHPPPIAIGFDAPEPITVCCSAPICCDLPTGCRQTTISLPEGAKLCFFSDGLPEARAGDDLLGRERLFEITRELGPSIGAPALLERIRSEATATPDDMVACIVSAASAPTASAASTASAAPTAAVVPASRGEAAASRTAGVQVEELEVEQHELAEPRVRYFLAACGFDSAGVSSLLAQAGEIAGGAGTALLRVERPRSGEPTGTVSAGRAVPDAAALSAEPIVGAVGPALTLATAR
jgi:hypothetical protein